MKYLLIPTLSFFLVFACKSPDTKTANVAEEITDPNPPGQLDAEFLKEVKVLNEQRQIKVKALTDTLEVLCFSKIDDPIVFFMDVAESGIIDSFSFKTLENVASKESVRKEAYGCASNFLKETKTALGEIKAIQRAKRAPTNIKYTLLIK